MALNIFGDDEEFGESKEVEAFRQAIARRIALESDRLVDELFGIVYDPETEAKVKISAISMLLDRGIPKLGIKHSKEDEVEEKGSRKQLREEIERMLLNEEDEEE